MEEIAVVLCDSHKKPCLLKTGVKEGSNFGKSFYICGQNDGRCDFVKTSTIQSTLCSTHDGHLVELQAVVFSRSTGEKRHYYRCTAGRRQKKNWCGHRVTAQNKVSCMTAQNKNKENPNSEYLEKVCENDTKLKGSTDNALKDVNSITVSTKPSSKASPKTLSQSHESHQKNAPLVNDQNAESSSDEDCVVLRVEKKKPVQPQNVEPKISTVTSNLGQAGTKKTLSLNKPQSSRTEISDSSKVVVKKPVDAVTSVRHNVNSQRASENVVSNEDAVAVDVPLSQRLKHCSQSSISSGRTNSSSSTSSSDPCSPEVKGHASTAARQVAKSNYDSDSSDSSSSDNSSSHQSHSRSNQKKSIPENGSIVISSSGSEDGVGRVAVRSVAVTDEATASSSKVVTLSGQSQHKTSGQAVVTRQDGASSKVIAVSDLVKRMENLTTNIRADQQRKQILENRLKDQKSTMKTINVSRLPDGGQKLLGNIDRLEEAISSLTLNIAAGQQKLQKVKQVIPKDYVVKKVYASDTHRQAAPPVQSSAAPNKALVQTKILAHAQPLPAHVIQQMYAANPQMQTLYGGRMTAARLKEVGSVTSDALERLHKQLESQPDATLEADDPAGLKVTLMTHQRQALSWLMWREQQHPPGGILADDMGLGKTLTTISLILKQREVSQSEKGESDQWINREQQIKKLGSEIVKSDATLIVCPASLIHQWNKEIERRCRPGLLKVLIYHGTNRENNILKLADYDVILTTYNIISKEVGITEDMKKSKSAKEMPATDKDAESSLPTCEQPVLLRIAWRRLVLDEAHCIKNNKSLTAMSVCRLRAGCRWALTGTPIQNNLMDMYSLLRFLRCSPFDEFKVWKRQVDNKSAKGTQRLNTLVKTLLLRRTKEQKGAGGKALVPLPKKSIETHKLKLTEAEKGIYDKIFEQSKKTLQNYLKRQEDKCKEKESLNSGGRHPWAGSDSHSGSANQNADGAVSLVVGGADKSRTPGAGQILLLLLRLRQCCSHLSLMKNALDVEALQADDGLDLDIVEQMEQLVLGEAADLKEPEVKTSAMFDDTFASTKINAVMGLIKDVRKNASSKLPIKSVVVSQWTRMLEVIERHLVDIGLRCCVIKGCIPPAKRMELVDTFNNDPTGPEVMLVSLRAGGVGLNLIGGNHLFLLDMHWNPALEDQACDRVYRVGQKKDVFIHRFICQETVEEKIVELQNRKKSLASNVLSGAKATANKLTLADLKELFGLTTSPVGGATFRPASGVSAVGAVKH